MLGSRAVEQTEKLEVSEEHQRPFSGSVPWSLDTTESRRQTLGNLQLHLLS